MSSQDLFGRSILITRSPTQSSEFRELLEAHGATVLEVATIEIRPRPVEEIDPFARTVADWQWVIFTSPNAARIFLSRCQEHGSLDSLRRKQGPRICAVGPATRRSIEDFDLEVDLIPENFQAEGVLDALSSRVKDWDSLKVLLPVASKARAVLPDTLREKGADLAVLPVYDTVPPEDAAEELQKLLSHVTPDLIAVTSSSTAKNFLTLCRPEFDASQYAFASIGPITSRTCRELGLEVAVEASASTIPDLVEAIRQHWRR